jgi:NDP-sugar pyrophosphorylase family protein
MLPVAILAGGLATRLRPMTEKIPKALIDVAGRPFIAWQLEQLRMQGIKKVVLCTGYLGEMLEQIIGDGQSYGLQISYSYDGDRLLGTGGALKKAIPLLGDVFFVLYGDSYLNVNFRQVEAAYTRSGCSGLMTALANQNQWDSSNIMFKNGKLFEYNKRTPTPQMHYIDYGLGILKAESFEYYSEAEPLDLADIYHDLSIKGDLHGYEVYNRFYEIGSHKGLAETENYLRQQGKK